MPRNRAFTLIELLVVVAIIALLIAILLPSLSRARQQTRTAACLSNLRQLVFAAHAYSHTNDGHYPSAYYTTIRAPTIILYEWDFKTTRNWITGAITVRPGLLWPGKANVEVHQCPSFRGASTGIKDPYTGYNYNTSYIGHGSSESIPPPIKVTDVRRAGTCALFGDGQWASGANKFMRAPWANPADAGFAGRYSGTQGYRHLNRTDVAYCDGHAAPQVQRFTNTYPSDVPRIAEGTGFLSFDNNAYRPDAVLLP